MIATCRLCRDHSAVLRQSHIIPRFVGKYLKSTSGTGFLMAMGKSGKTKRAQDLCKTSLLCSDCELRIAEHEQFVAEKVFRPYKDGSLQSIPMDEHIGKFAVSVSLRALWVLLEAGDPWTVKWREALLPLDAEWRKYLLETPGFRKGESTHHMFLSSPRFLVAGLKTAPTLVTGVFRSSASYMDEQFGEAFIFANMAGMQTLSMVSSAKLPCCCGTEVYPNQTFGVQPCGIGWGGYFQTILGLANRCEVAAKSICRQHKTMIERSIRKDPMRLVNSEDHQIHKWQKNHLRESHKTATD